LRDLKNLTEQMMTVLANDKPLMTSFKRFAARIDDWLKADLNVAEERERVEAGEKQADSGDDEEVLKTARRKRTLFSNVGGVLDADFAERGSQNEFLTSTQNDDVDFNIETPRC
jgi:hypothetical protein